MATQGDLNSLKKVLLGGVDNGNPNHYRNGKAYCKNAGGNVVIAGLIVAGIGIVFSYAVDWLISPVERPRKRPMNNNGKRY